MKTHLMSVRSYINQRFKGEDRPAPKTIIQSIKDCIISGQKIGREYFVEVDENGSEIDPISKVLMH